MIRQWKRREHQPARPLSNRAITLGIVIVLGFAVVAFTALLWRYGGAGTDVELDAIRTAGALTAAAGGAATLLLAARRQVHTERDTSEQRITELYTRAVDQLGAEKAPIRLGGLHALECLAQNNSAQRQTIVDVICAYLRMPYTPPPDRTHTHSIFNRSPGTWRRRHRTLINRPPTSPTPTLRYHQAREEEQARLTAQRILTAHLKPKAVAAFWADIDLNLTEAHLHQLDLSACHIRSAQFDWATFTGNAVFRGATFAGEVAGFDEATFNGNAWFRSATFAGMRGSSRRRSLRTQRSAGRCSGTRGSAARRSGTLSSMRRRSPETWSLMGHVCPRAPFAAVCRWGGPPSPLPKGR